METKRFCPRCNLELSPDVSPNRCPKCEMLVAFVPLPDDRTGDMSPPRIRLGDYELVRRLNSGGMGVVYCAQQLSAKRQVALKMIRPELLENDEIRKRFLREAETAANLKHPNIVPIFEVGKLNDCPFFSMQLIKGQSLADLFESEDWKQQAPLAGERLGWMVGRIVKVARAVHYAHQMGVLHRDLKPGNILLDEDQEPMLTDFGLAKRIEQDFELTQTNAAMGTPSYMSREQAMGKTAQATIFSDIYGLGAILYRAIAGRAPFIGDSNDQILHCVIHEEAQRASLHNPNLSRDLDTICLKCLEKDPTKRYGSAEALADDLDHWLRDEPITARPVPWSERLWKWMRRKPDKAGLIGVATVSVGLLVAAGFRVSHLVGRYYQQKGFNQAATLFDAGKPASAVSTLSQLVDTYPEFDLASSRLACALTQHSFPSARLPHPVSVTDMDYAPDARHLATADIDGTIRIWETLRGGLAASLAHPSFSRDGSTETADAAQCVSFHPNGVEIIAGFASGRIEIWNWRQERMRHEETVDGLVRDLQVHPDGKRILAVSVHELRIIDSELKTGWRRRDGTNIFFSAAFDPQGRFIATGNAGDGAINLWSATNATPLAQWREHKGTIRTLQFDAEGSHLISGSDDGTARIRNARSRSAQSKTFRHSHPVLSAMLDASGTRLVTLTSDQKVRVWNAVTGDMALDPLPHPEDKQVSAALFHPRGGFILTACNDGMIRAWDAQSGQLFGAPAVHELDPPHNEFPYIDLVVPSGNGTQFATTGADHAVRLWGFPGSQIPIKPLRLESGSLAFTMGQDDRFAWSAHADSLRAQQVLPKFGAVQTFRVPSAQMLSASPMSAIALASTDDGHILLVGEGRANPVLLARDKTVLGTGWTSDGTRFWIRTEGKIEFHDVRNPEQPAFAWPIEPGVVWNGLTPDNAMMGWATPTEIRFKRLTHPNEDASRVPLPDGWKWGRYSRDSSRLLVLSRNGHALLVNVQRGRLESKFHSSAPVQAADLSEDASIVATLTASKNLTIWAAGRDRKPESTQELKFEANSLSLSRDGRLLALASPSRFMVLLDVRSGQAVSDRIYIGGSVWNVRFAADDQWLMANTEEAPVMWEIPPLGKRAPPWLAMMGASATSPLLHSASSQTQDGATARQVLSLALGGGTQMDEAVRWTTWLYADPRDRTVSVSSTIRVMDYLFERFHPEPDQSPSP